MNYFEAIDKIVAYGTLTREQATLLIFQSGDISQSWNGVRVVCERIDGTFKTSYDVYQEI